MSAMTLPAFNRVLARHLALALTAGAPFDRELVMRCYRMAGRDAELILRGREDPLAMEIRTLCIDHDLGVLQRNEARLRMMSQPQAETELLRLLNPDLRVTGVESEERLF